MKIKALETGKEYELCAIAADSGVEWTQDLIGNHGAFNADQFHRNDADEIVAPQAEIDWWLPVVANLNKASELKEEAKARGLMTEKAYAELQSIACNDLDDQAAAEVEFFKTLLGDE